MATAVKVNIYNQAYNLRANGDDDQYVRHIAEYVDARMQEISAQTNVLDYGKIAVLAALNIADELHRARQFQEPRENANADAATEDAGDARAPEERVADASTGDAPPPGNRMSWNYADIFEELPERKDSGERMSQQVISKIRHPRGDDNLRRRPDGED